jgi:peptidoglycan-associated lipoprotein
MMDGYKGRLLTATALLLVTGGCATVKQDEFRAEMDRVRTEMAEADAAVENRLNGRVDGVETSMMQLEARMDALETDLVALGAEMDATVQRLEASLRFTAPIHFGFDEAVVDADGRETLARFAGVVGEHYPGAVVTVEGFTDPSGTAEYNLRLGQRRADAVKTVLVDEAGMNGEQVRAVSYGEDTRRLVAPGQSGPGQRGMANRRVVLVIEHAGTTPAAIVAGS